MTRGDIYLTFIGFIIEFFIVVELLYRYRKREFLKTHYKYEFKYSSITRKNCINDSITITFVISMIMLTIYAMVLTWSIPL